MCGSAGHVRAGGGALTGAATIGEHAVPTQREWEPQTKRLQKLHSVRICIGSSSIERAG